MALTKVTGGLISTTSNYEVGVITATKFVGPIEGGVTGITTGSDKIKVIDESSDTTCFPLFATHSDGYLAAKSGSNLTFNSNNGTLTATTFSGALTGNVNGNATGLSGTPSIVVQDITAEMVSVAGTMQYEDVVNVDATGIITAGGGLVVPANKMVTITGDLNVDGKTDLDDLSVAGVSTFADDVNLQGVNAGVTSAYWDKSANSLIFKDNSKAVFGTGSDVSMYNATNFHIEKTGTDGSGIRIHVPTNESIEFQQAQATVMATFTANGSCSLYNNTVKRIETTNTGIDVTGTITLDAVAGTNHAAALNVLFQTASGTIDGGSGLTYHPANDTLTVNGADISANQFRGSGGEVRLSNDNHSSTDYIKVTDKVELFDGGSVKLTTSSTGITVTGEVAASQDYPTVRPTLDLNFVATNKLDPRVRFFRNSHATYIDKDGIVRIVGNNTPRFDYDPETKECLGLLMEGESSSRLTQSSHITASGTYHQTITDNYYKGPDDIEGSAREYIHRGDSGSATGGSTTIWANQAIGIANPVSVSCFVKITRGSSMGFEFYDNNNNLNSHRVDISGGYISDGSYATVSTNDPGNAEGTTSYQRFPNGWVKIKWENISKSGGNATTYLQMYLQNHATSTVANPAGYAVWGFQVENEAFCTSTIIKTKTDVAQVREREVAIIEKEDFADFWNPLEGTAYVDVLMPHPYGNSGIPAYSLKHTVNTSHSIAFLRDNGSSPVYLFFNDGSGVLSRSAAASDSRYRSALAFKEADINGAVNGVASMNQTSAFTMQKFDYMYLGSLNTGDNDLHGHLKRFTYYPKKLSDNQLLNITS